MRYVALFRIFSWEAGRHDAGAAVPDTRRRGSQSYPPLQGAQGLLLNFGHLVSNCPMLAQDEADNKRS